MCSAIAVIGGTVLSKKIKPKQMAALGAAVFLFFGLLGFYDMWKENAFACLKNRLDGSDCVSE